MKTGTFRPAPGSTSLTGKQFGLDFDETLKFADKYTDAAAIMKVDVPKSSVSQFDFSTSIDPHIFKSGVITVQPGSQQTLLNRTLTNIEHAF